MTRRWRVDAHALRHERKSGVLQEPRGGALSQPSALRLRERLPSPFDCQRMFGKVNLVEEGRPFVGNAGKLLDELLEEAGIDHSKLYVTNVVKIRPTKESGGAPRTVRRERARSGRHWSSKGGARSSQTPRPSTARQHAGEGHDKEVVHHQVRARHPIRHRVWDASVSNLPSRIPAP